MFSTSILLLADSRLPTRRRRPPQWRLQKLAVEKIRAERLWISSHSLLPAFLPCLGSQLTPRVRFGSLLYMKHRSPSETLNFCRSTGFWMKKVSPIANASCMVFLSSLPGHDDDRS